MRIGIVLSGGPASGGHNCICGLFDFLTERIHADSRLYGFMDGPSGLIDSKYIHLTRAIIDKFRNQGGFHMIGSGRTKIETDAQFKATAAVCSQLQLDGLVIVGGDDSNTNAALLAEYFKKTHHRTRCVGVPKTIDGDLRNEYIEMSFGFDTATKVYSEQVAALCADAVSARKTVHFCRLMGRTASHITLEVALQTHPNVTLIGEEIQAKGHTLSSITKSIADVISTRALQGKHYGCVILPEGLVDFLPDVGALIQELNELMAENKERGLPANISAHLTPASANLFASLPPTISQQLLLDRDPHGNVQVSKIESERLVSSLVEQELGRRKKLGTYKGNPSFVCHFLGYEVSESTWLVWS
jgi:pyrophosphate--fructose-6-phosphate 1-phosphotransferase